MLWASGQEPLPRNLKEEGSWHGGRPCLEMKIRRVCSRPGVLNVQDLMPNNLRWSCVIIVDIKCIISVMCLKHPETDPWKSSFLGTWSMVPKSLETAALDRGSGL